MRTLITSLMLVGIFTFLFSCKKAGNCSIPVNLSTTSINGSSATFHWSSVNGPYAPYTHNINNFLTSAPYTVRYRFITDTSSWGYALISQDSVTITTLSAATTYQWQVRTNCSSGSSDYSALQTFTTDSIGSWFFKGITYAARHTAFYGHEAEANGQYPSTSPDTPFNLHLYFFNAPNLIPGVYSVSDTNIPMGFSAVLALEVGPTYDYYSTGLDNAKAIVTMSPSGKLNIHIASLAVYGTDTATIVNINLHQQ